MGKEGRFGFVPLPPLGPLRPGALKAAWPLLAVLIYVPGLRPLARR